MVTSNVTIVALCTVGTFDLPTHKYCIVIVVYNEIELFILMTEST